MGGHGGIGVHVGVRILRGAPGWLAEIAYTPLHHQAANRRHQHNSAAVNVAWNRHSMYLKVIKREERKKGTDQRRQLPADFTLASRQKKKGGGGNKKHANLHIRSDLHRSTLANIDKSISERRCSVCSWPGTCTDAGACGSRCVELLSEIASTRPPGRRSGIRTSARPPILSCSALQRAINSRNILLEHSSNLLCCLQFSLCSSGAFYCIRLRLTSHIKRFIIRSS